ncbi:uncharacterized protein IWZ02DRAFT_369371 [Phyllosticta citriasiana]|uniref:uncharacterized protein n=1 Tax=Phyllosticta citriasiana TaxID=595635 RepID=UPI0030FD6974
MSESKEQGNNDEEQAKSRRLFNPRDLSNGPPTFSLPGETWTSMLETPVSFEPEYFQKVMLNLIKHPDIASTYLFRAEIFYDSFNDPEGKFVQHIKAEYRPLPCEVPGYSLEQTIVRRMIPRNPQRDDPLVQTCHVFRRRDAATGTEENLVIYLPHADNPEDVPFYHPTVHSLAFLHRFPSSTSAATSSSPTSLQPTGTFSLHYRLFPSSELTTRLRRTALTLLTLINKHSLGQKAGYRKRVHHDVVVPQAAFQDTYTDLKARYAKRLIDGWVEQTPAGKHVFEDLGIASFLIEVWKAMYDVTGRGGETAEAVAAATGDEKKGTKKPPFPGFVDIGCGNGLLVYILLSEGFRGWGFDARRRKTWVTFPASVQEHLKEMVLVPEIFTRMLPPPADATTTTAAPAAAAAAAATKQSSPSSSPSLNPEPTTARQQQRHFHNGIFAPGTFIISNHADELTPWTPLLASLSSSPFLAIPCCSHNFNGARFRAPASGKAPSNPAAINDGGSNNGNESGTLPRRDGKQPSAYASLTAWVARLAATVGYEVEAEMMRIPSTRNAGVLGRRRRQRRQQQQQRQEEAGNESADKAEDGVDAELGDVEGLEERLRVVRDIVAAEMFGERAVSSSGGCALLEGVAREWVERAEKLMKGAGGGH